MKNNNSLIVPMQLYVKLKCIIYNYTVNKSLLILHLLYIKSKYVIKKANIIYLIIHLK